MENKNKIRNEKKFNECFEKFEPLLGKNIYFENTLYKVIKYSTVYIYCNEYELNDELQLNNDILFLCGSTDNTIYRNFKNTLIKKKIVKLKITEFHIYIILDDNEDINNIYFADGELERNYINSEFYKTKGIIEARHNIYKFIYFNRNRNYNNDSEYYSTYSHKCIGQYILEFFNKYQFIVELPLDEKNIYFNELQNKHSNLEICFYDVFLKLYEEYKRIQKLELKA